MLTLGNDFWTPKYSEMRHLHFHKYVPLHLAATIVPVNAVSNFHYLHMHSICTMTATDATQKPIPATSIRTNFETVCMFCIIT